MELVESYLQKIQLEADVVSAAYKEYLDKAKKVCNKFKSHQQVQCMVRAKIEAKKAQLSKLKKLSSDCKSAQSPNDCNRRLYKKAQTINKQIQPLIIRYREISAKIQKAQANQ